MNPVCRCLLGPVFLAVSCASLAAGDAKRGAALFGQCTACHSIKPGEHLTGPSLARVWGRKAASAEGFRRYSEALKGADLRWNATTLDRWLADPQGFVPGNNMTFAGMKDGQARQDLAAFLEAASEGKAPEAPAARRGMMMGRSQPADLKKAGPDSKVVSLTHCADTYTVKTADGATHSIWEYNLRLKTDSSDRGPQPGAPVITGSGMRGDRASIVFAKPAEITPFIKQSCE